MIHMFKRCAMRSLVRTFVNGLRETNRHRHEEDEHEFYGLYPVKDQLFSTEGLYEVKDDKSRMCKGGC